MSIQSQPEQVQQFDNGHQPNQYWMQIALAEYEHIFQESQNAISNQHHVLTIGFTLMIALFAGAFLIPYASDADPSRFIEFRLIALKGLIPAAATIGNYLWIVEIQRMMRAGQYLYILEKRFSSMFTFSSETLVRFNKYFKLPLETPRLITRPAFWHTWLRYFGSDYTHPMKPKKLAWYYRFSILWFTCAWNAVSLFGYKYSMKIYPWHWDDIVFGLWLLTSVMLLVITWFSTSIVQLTDEQLDVDVEDDEQTTEQ